MDEKILLKELTEIKKLLILSLINKGVTDEVIGKVLGVSSTRIRQIVPLKAARGKNETK